MIASGMAPPTSTSRCPRSMLRDSPVRGYRACSLVVGAARALTGARGIVAGAGASGDRTVCVDVSFRGNHGVRCAACDRRRDLPRRVARAHRVRHPRALAAAAHRRRLRDPLRAGAPRLPPPMRTPPMTSRARDVVPLTIGLYLIALGAVLLLDSTDVHTIGVEGAVGTAFGLAFVALGVLAFLAAWRVRRFSRKMRRAVGHLRSDASGWTVEDDAVISTVVGDIALDLRDADLPEGETELAVLCWLGTIQVRVPREFGVDVTAQSIVGSVDVLGEREEGVVRDIHVRSEGYEQQTHRVRLRISTFVGELLVVQV
ncbi:MAG: hypothetical protein F4X80_02870 [Chloroflexi bacterium]|nr:hypothetical protein [Chloroflexota bacterium]